MWGNFSLNHYLTSTGFVVSPKLLGKKEQHLDGGYTLRTNGSSNVDRIEEVQLEMAHSIRIVIYERQFLVQNLAYAIGSIVNHYVPN